MKMEGSVWTAPDKSFTKTIIKCGTGLERPNEGTVCQVNIEVNNDVLLNRGLFGYQVNQDTKLTVGDGVGELSGMIDSALETMRAGESCLLDISPEIIREVGLSQAVGDGDGPVSKCSFKICLVHFERSKDVHDLNLKEKTTRMRNYKAFGGECFKLGKINLAEKFYIRALKYAIISSKFIEEDEFKEVVEKFWALNNLCLLNLAACQLKSKRYEHVIANCTKAIVIDENYPKGYYRRGQAHMALQDYELALEDFKTGLKLEPNSKPLQQQLKIAQGKVKQLERSYAQSMKKLFD